jgi:hypothetical protein
MSRAILVLLDRIWVLNRDCRVVLARKFVYYLDGEKAALISVSDDISVLAH